jgi:hypothetical protein
VPEANAAHQIRRPFVLYPQNCVLNVDREREVHLMTSLSLLACSLDQFLYAAQFGSSISEFGAKQVD